MVNEMVLEDESTKADQMKLGNGFWLETLTHELYKEWEIGFEILEDKGSILRSFSGWSNLKKVILEITGAQSDYCRISEEIREANFV